MIGKPEPTVFVEHQVVWRAQRNVTAVRVQVGDFTSLDVHLLNATANVFRRIKFSWVHKPTQFHWRESTAVVAHVQEPAWTQCETIRQSVDGGNS